MSENMPIDSNPAHYHNCNVDETALAATLEGIEEPGHYFEIIVKTETIFISLGSLFPVVRVLFRSSIYTIARVYPGCAVATNQQLHTIADLYAKNNNLIDYAERFTDGTVVI